MPCARYVQAVGSENRLSSVIFRFARTEPSCGSMIVFKTENVAASYFCDGDPAI